MKLNISQTRNIIYTFIVFLFCSNLASAQQFQLINQESTLTVFGTSNLHDWHITTENQSGKIIFNDVNTCDIKLFEISVQAESLKSGKKSMDKNTYKALKTKDYKTINFHFVKLDDIVKKSDGKFNVKISGDLTISGVKNRIIINFDIDTSKANTIILSGEKIIKMTDYNVEPPTALFGTITTGNEITITFESIFK